MFLTFGEICELRRAHRTVTIVTTRDGAKVVETWRRD